MTDSEKLDLLLSKMQGMEDKMQGMEDKMRGMEDRMQGMENEMKGMKNEMQDIKNEIQVLKQQTSDTEANVTQMKLMLENEIRTNIKRIAEGHLHLSRNLHDVLKIDSENEMLAIRVSVLESEVSRIKDRLEIA